jgi:hypothetical protein
MLVGLLFVPGASRAALPALQSDTICTTPAVVPFPDESSEIPAPASPIASPVSVLSATPIASPVAMPAADDEAPITQLVNAIGACQNERRARTMTRFVTEGYLGDFYAGGGRITRDQFVEFARGLPRVPVAIVSVSVSEIVIDSDGSATAEVVSTIGNQLFRATWSFIFVPEESADATGSEPIYGVWLADGVEPLPVELPDGARKIDVELDEYDYDPDSLRVRGPDIAINAVNRGDEDHELLVLSLADGVSTRDLLTVPGPELPPGVIVIGQATIPAGMEGTLVLVGMEKGGYAIVDLLLTEEGTPHLALGMEATLTVR